MKLWRFIALKAAFGKAAVGVAAKTVVGVAAKAAIVHDVVSVVNAVS